MNSEISVVEKEIPELVERAGEVAGKIVNEDGYQSAGRFLQNIKGALKKIEEVFGPIVEKAHQAHKEAVNQKKTLESPLRTAEAKIKDAMGNYFLEQERARKAEEAKQMEILKKLEEEDRLRNALALEDKGEGEAAAAVISAPIVTHAVVLPKIQAKGVGVREAWEAEIVDLRALIRAVADGKAAAELLSPNMTVLNSMARSLRNGLNIPGVRAVARQVVSARSM